MAAQAQPGWPVLSARDIAEQLSPREFIKLCGQVDGLFGKKEKVVSKAHGKGDLAAAADRVLNTPFDVLDILRDGKHLRVIIVADQSGGPVRVSVK
jgi:hypothetical protein